MADDQKGLERKRHSSKNKSQDNDQKREDSNEEQKTSIPKSQISYTYQTDISHANLPESLENGVLKPPKETPRAPTNQKERSSFSTLATPFLFASLETPILLTNLEASFTKSSLEAPYSGVYPNRDYLYSGASQASAYSSERQESPHDSMKWAKFYESKILDTYYSTSNKEDLYTFISSGESQETPSSRSRSKPASYSGARLENLHASASRETHRDSTSREKAEASASQENRYSLSNPGTLFSSATPGSPFPGATQASANSGARQKSPPDSRKWAKFNESKIWDTYNSTSNNEDIYSFFSSRESRETPRSLSRSEPALLPPNRIFDHLSYSQKPARLSASSEQSLSSSNLEPACASLGSGPEPARSHLLRKLNPSHLVLDPALLQILQKPSLPPPSRKPAGTSSRKPSLADINQKLSREHPIWNPAHLPPRSDIVLSDQELALSHPNLGLDAHSPPRSEHAHWSVNSDSTRSSANLEPTLSHPSQKYARSFPRPGPSQLPPRSEPVHSPASVKHFSLPASPEPAQSPSRPEPAHLPANVELVSLPPRSEHAESPPLLEPAQLPPMLKSAPSSPILSPAQAPPKLEPIPLPAKVEHVSLSAGQQPPRLSTNSEDFSVKYYRESVIKRFFPITAKNTNVLNVQKGEIESKEWPPFVRSWFHTLPHHAQESFLEFPLSLQLQLPSWHTNIQQKIFSLPKEEMKIAFKMPCEFLKQYFHLSNSLRRELPLCSLKDFQEINKWLYDHQQQFYTWPSTVRQLLGEWYHSMLEFISPPIEFDSKVNCKERIASPSTARNVAFLGSPRCGKTSFILSLQGKLSQSSEGFHEFNPTIFEREVIVCEKFPKKLRFIDADMTNYFEIYDSVKNGDLVILCYAIDDIDSFLQAMGKWYNVVRKISPKIFIFLVGLKCDRRDGKTNRSLDGRPAVPLKVIKKVFYLFRIAMEFECSSFTHHNITHAFHMIGHILHFG